MRSQPDFNRVMIIFGDVGIITVMELILRFVGRPDDEVDETIALHTECMKDLRERQGREICVDRLLCWQAAMIELYCGALSNTNEI